MSKYTYHIKLGAADYVQVYPSNKIKLRGVWVEDTWIPRVEIDNVKIAKWNNTTIYNSLVSYWDDTTKFSTSNYFQIKANGSEKWTFKFGIKWGKLNRNTGTYEVKPDYYDYYHRFWFPRLESEAYLFDNTATFEIYDNDTANYPYDGVVTEYNTNNVKKLWEMYNGIFNVMSPTPDYVSTLLNNDTSGSMTINTTNGMVMDYVTGKENIFLSGGVNLQNVFGKSCSEMLDYLKLFQIYPVLDTATRFRLEHVYYMIYYAENNAVSISFEEDENEWEYVEEKIPITEKLELHTVTEDNDEDFATHEIVYDTARTGVNGGNMTHGFNRIYTNLAYYEANTGDFSQDIFIAGTEQQIRKLGSTASTSNVDFNTFEETDTSAITLSSNDIKITSGDVLAISLNTTNTGSIANYICYLYDRTGSASMSSSQAISAGSNTFNLTATATTNACLVRIVATPSAGSITIDGWVTASKTGKYRVAWEEGVTTESDKLNGAFSQANILENWWKKYRPTNSGTINDVAKAYDDSQYILRRKAKKQLYTSDIDMLKGVNDGTRIGIIETYTRDLDTDYVEFAIIYPEDE